MDSPEAARLVRLVEQLREAPNADKRPFLDALTAAPCRAPVVCAMKATCTQGYREHVDAYTELQRLRSDLDAKRGGVVIADLRAVRARLAAAQSEIEACIDAEGTVRRTYRL